MCKGWLPLGCWIGKGRRRSVVSEGEILKYDNECGGLQDQRISFTCSGATGVLSSCTWTISIAPVSTLLATWVAIVITSAKGGDEKLGESQHTKDKHQGSHGSQR